MLIAGPCVIESETHAVGLAARSRDQRQRAGVPFIFKASFDKANRTSARSFRGPGIDEGLRILAARQRSRRRADPHRHSRTLRRRRRAAEVADVLQIPAFLVRQTDLLVAAAGPDESSTSRRDSSSHRTTCSHAIEKVIGAGQPQVIVTERGTSFGYHNLVVDMRAFPIMRAPRLPGGLRCHSQPAAARRRRRRHRGPSGVHRAAGLGRGGRRRGRRVHGSARAAVGAKSDAQNALRLDRWSGCSAACFAITPSPRPRHSPQAPA